jgi:hypothetical protein
VKAKKVRPHQANGEGSKSGITADYAAANESSSVLEFLRQPDQESFLAAFPFFRPNQFRRVCGEFSKKKQPVNNRR